MKHLLLLLSFLITTNVLAQSINTQVDAKKPYLVGKINKEGLETPPYSSWFEKNYQAGKPDPGVIEQLQNQLSEYTIKAFLGTWCGDSRREIPKLYNVLDAAQFPLDRLTTVALDKRADSYRQSPGGEQEAMKVFRVPTIILFKDGKEVNRIIERPKVSIEADLLAMIAGNYTPNYADVTALMELMEELGPEKFERKLDRIARNQGAQLEHYYGLHTLAKVWYAAHKQDEAITITRLNCKLFPQEKGPKLLLASYMEDRGLTTDAGVLYREVLQLEADNTTAKNALKRLDTK